MKIDERKNGEVVILDIEAEIDLYNAPVLSKYLQDTLDKGHLKVVMNLSQVPFVDSSGIGALVSSLALYQENNGIFVLSNLQKSIQDLLNYIQLADQFLIFGEESEAIEFFEED